MAGTPHSNTMAIQNNKRPESEMHRRHIRFDGKRKRVFYDIVSDQMKWTDRQCARTIFSIRSLVGAPCSLLRCALLAFRMTIQFINFRRSHTKSYVNKWHYCCCVVWQPQGQFLFIIFRFLHYRTLLTFDCVVYFYIHISFHLHNRIESNRIGSILSNWFEQRTRPVWSVRTVLWRMSLSFQIEVCVSNQHIYATNEHRRSIIVTSVEIKTMFWDKNLHYFLRRYQFRSDSKHRRHGWSLLIELCHSNKMEE